MPGSHAAQTTRERRLKGRCYLCGDPAKGIYCWTHAWAGNQARPDTALAQASTYRDGFRDGYRRGSVPSRPAGTLGKVGSLSSPAGRRRVAEVESVSASNRQPREATT